MYVIASQKESQHNLTQSAILPYISKEEFRGERNKNLSGNKNIQKEKEKFIIYLKGKVDNSNT